MQPLPRQCLIKAAVVTTYQERLANYWTKVSQRIRNVLQVTGRRCYNVSGTSCKLLDEDVTRYQGVVIDNADHRTLLHPPTPQKGKRQCTKVTTVPPKTSWLNNFGSAIRVEIKKPLPAFYTELRGQTFAHCDTYAEYTRGLSTSTRPDLVLPAAETVLTDGRMDVKKKADFCFKMF